MAYILRCVIVDDVEAEKQRYAATAAQRRRCGVARETYFVNPRRPHELVIAFDGDELDQLYAALRASEDDTRTSQPVLSCGASAPPEPARGELEAAIEVAEAARERLGRQLRALRGAAAVPRG